MQHALPQEPRSVLSQSGTDDVAFAPHVVLFALAAAAASNSTAFRSAMGVECVANRRRGV
eukprot:498689-Prymnesium_polylepis.1